jgi:hypothetical protein
MKLFIISLHDKICGLIVCTLLKVWYITSKSGTVYTQTS